MEFWKTKEWLELKMHRPQKTEKLLSKVEYLKMVGWKNCSDERYKEYLKTMNEKTQLGKRDAKKNQ